MLPRPYFSTSFKRRLNWPHKNLGSSLRSIESLSLLMLSVNYTFVGLCLPFELPTKLIFDSALDACLHLPNFCCYTKLNSVQYLNIAVIWGAEIRLPSSHFLIGFSETPVGWSMIPLWLPIYPWPDSRLNIYFLSLLFWFFRSRSSNFPLSWIARILVISNLCHF